MILQFTCFCQVFIQEASSFSGRSDPRIATAPIQSTENPKWDAAAKTISIHIMPPGTKKCAASLSILIVAVSKRALCEEPFSNLSALLSA